MASHKDNLQWLIPTQHPMRGIPQSVFEELLVKSPALEVSVRSQGFIDRFGIGDSADAEIFFNHLTDGVLCLKSKGDRFASSADDVEDLLAEKGLLSGEFWLQGEFMVFTVSRETKSQVREFVKRLSESNKGLKNQKKELIQVKFSQVDSLFRHIRNALAHGAFRFVRVGNEEYVIFQDANKEGMMSARIVLKLARLESWITEFCRLERVGV